MENFTANIESLLNEKLSLYRQLNDLVREERDYIVNIDVDSLWKSAEKKKQIAGDIQKIKDRIMSSIENGFGINDLDANSLSLSYLLRIVPVETDQKKRLRQLKLAIDAEKNELEQAASDNKHYVQEYLMVIDDIMSVAVNTPNENQYSHTGNISQAKASNCLIHAEV